MRERVGRRTDFGLVNNPAKRGAEGRRSLSGWYVEVSPWLSSSEAINVTTFGPTTPTKPEPCDASTLSGRLHMPAPRVGRLALATLAASGCLWWWHTRRRDARSRDGASEAEMALCAGEGQAPAATQTVSLDNRECAPMHVRVLGELRVKRELGYELSEQELDYMALAADVDGDVEQSEVRIQIDVSQPTPSTALDDDELAGPRLALSLSLADAHAALGALFVVAGLHHDAVRCYRAAIALDHAPDGINHSRPAGAQRGGAGSQQHGNDQSAGDGDTNNDDTRAPRRCAVRIALGLALFALGDHQGEERAYRAALKEHETSAMAHYKLAHCLQRAGDTAGAESACRAALLSEPTFIHGLNNLASLLEVIRRLHKCKVAGVGLCCRKHSKDPESSPDTRCLNGD